MSRLLGGGSIQLASPSPAGARQRQREKPAARPKSRQRAWREFHATDAFRLREEHVPSFPHLLLDFGHVHQESQLLAGSHYTLNSQEVVANPNESLFIGLLQELRRHWPLYPAFGKADKRRQIRSLSSHIHIGFGFTSTKTKLRLLGIGILRRASFALGHFQLQQTAVTVQHAGGIEALGVEPE